MKKASDFIKVDQYVSVIGGSVDTDQVCCDGGIISAVTTPGCWGPMITPRIFGGHEVIRPVYIEGAQPGDSVAIFIEKVEVVSKFCSSGTGRPNEGRFDGDPSVKAICPHCGISHPETYLEGSGEDAIRCVKCGNPIMPQTYKNGYTVAYSKENDIAVAVNPQGAAQIAEMTGKGEVFLPENSKQHLATIIGRADFDGLPIRSRPMVGNIGCVPSVVIPSSKNTGDFSGSLSKTDLYPVPTASQITDAHMDINLVGEGCVVISPVLVDGAGVYFGDVHLTQGCGEIAGHTLDICADVTVKVKVLKGLKVEGPILLPAVNELDKRFRPFSDEEFANAEKLYQQYGGGKLLCSYPIQIVGTGDSMNTAFDNALERAAILTGLSIDELKNRTTVGGEIRIGRTSGCIYLTVMLDSNTLEKAGLLDLVIAHYSND